MKIIRTSGFLAITLSAVSLVVFSSTTVRAASIVSSHGWYVPAPADSDPNAGPVALKRPAVNNWVRFEAPAVRRGKTITLSVGTLQFIKGATLEDLERRVAGMLTLAKIESVDSIDSAMLNIGVAGVEDSASITLTVANSRAFQLVDNSLSRVSLQESDAVNFAAGGNVETVVASNQTVTPTPAESEAVAGDVKTAPVPEPSVAALSALAITGLLARRRR